ncbi:DUF397 domain-containing protein [Nocardiopsis sp. NPDC049922]|uniref:DUF397 domain-containing protein n=1 Tax=Nocardiopsis sp. NPDC049922 TaxID=3155157 RepID=UPI0033EDAC41
MAEEPILSWYTSSYCADQGHCVQVAHSRTGPFMRDSMDHSGSVLWFSPQEWAAVMLAAQD